MAQVTFDDADTSFIELLKTDFRTRFAAHFDSYQLMIGHESTTKLWALLEDDIEMTTRLRLLKEAAATFVEEHFGIEAALFFAGRVQDVCNDTDTLYRPALTALANAHSLSGRALEDYRDAEAEFVRSRDFITTPEVDRKLHALEEQHPDLLGPVWRLLEEKYWPWLEGRLEEVREQA